MTPDALSRPPSRRGLTPERRADVTADLAAIAARLEELHSTSDAERASIAAIKATWVYRLTRAVRVLVPRRDVPHLDRRGADDAASARARAEEASLDPLELELISRRAELKDAEADAAQVHFELHHLQLSRPRRLWIALRSRSVLGQHPFWSLAAAGRALSSRGLIGGMATAWHRFVWNTALVRFQPFSNQTSDQPRIADAIRWLPPVRMSSRVRHALFMHPTSSVSFHIEPPASAQVIVDCGLLPLVWDKNHGGVRFELEVSVPATGWREIRRLHANPGDRFVDRRWLTMTVRLPQTKAPAVVVRLATALPPGCNGAYAWGIWGEPRIEWRRPSSERWRSVRALGARVRQMGIAGTLRQVRDLPASDEETARYRRWIEIHSPGAIELAAMASAVPTFRWRPRFSVITPVYNTDPKWLRACIESVRRQTYPDWELCLANDASTNRGTLRVLRDYEALNDPRIRIVHLPENRNIGGASAAAVELATGEFLAMLDHDDELAPEALFEVARYLNEYPDADWIYSDEDKLDVAGERCDPYFKPDWSPEHFRSTMYSCHLMVLRASLVREVGGFRSGYDGAQDYDLALRISERTTRIHHIPKMLYRWRKIPESVASSGAAKTWATDAGMRALEDHVRRCGLDATVVPGPAHGLYRMRHRIVGKPLVSIILPTAGRTRDVDGQPFDLLLNCLRSVVEKSTYDNYELVVADDGTISAGAEQYLAGVPHVRLHYKFSGVFNYARKLNFIVRHSHGEHLLLFNDDIEIITPEWIEAMLEFSQQQDIGVVGARLLFGDGRIQHIGMVMGVCGMAAHAFHMHPGSIPGYGSSALIIRNYSSVTAACMMTRRALYDAVGGFDERFIFDFNDTDYCLKLRQRNYRVVYTPYAEMYHLESATVSGRTWHASDLELMRARWADVCEHDPYYNPHLTRDFPDYRIRL